MHHIYIIFFLCDNEGSQTDLSFVTSEYKNPQKCIFQICEGFLENKNLKQSALFADF